MCDNNIKYIRCNAIFEHLNIVFSNLIDHIFQVIWLVTYLKNFLLSRAIWVCFITFTQKLHHLNVCNTYNLNQRNPKHCNTWPLITSGLLFKTPFQENKRWVRLNYLAVRRWNSRIHHSEPLLQIKCGQMRVWGIGGSVEEIMARLPAHSVPHRESNLLRNRSPMGCFADKHRFVGL